MKSPSVKTALTKGTQRYIIPYSGVEFQFGGLRHQWASHTFIVTYCAELILTYYCTHGYDIVYTNKILYFAVLLEYICNWICGKGNLSM